MIPTTSPRPSAGTHDRRPTVPPIPAADRAAETPTERPDLGRPAAERTRPGRTGRRRFRRAAIGVAALGVGTLVGVGELVVVEPPPAEAAPVPQTLRIGSNGASVKEVQRALIERGVAVYGGVDGVYGPATRRAVKKFQRSRGLSVTGTVDGATARALGLSSGSTSSSGSSGSAKSQLRGLGPGARGPAVEDLQRRLIAADVPVAGGADGVYGPATRRAVRLFQRWNGLRQTGRVNAATARHLPSGGSSAPRGVTSGSSSSSNSGSSSGSNSSSSGSWKGLEQGDRGTKVKKLQRALMSDGFFVRGGADGIFGPATAAALKAFQSVNGIRQTGVLTAKGARYLGLTGSSGSSGISSNAGYAVFGERGDRVRSLQRALVGAGISLAGGVDGAFGGATASAIMEFQRRRGLSVTGKVDASTAARLSLRPQAAPRQPSGSSVRLEKFPVQPPCWFGDTWLAPRGEGRTHQGVDIIAASGRRLYASFAGTVTKIYVDQPGSRAGNGVRITRSDGTYITYLHMKKLAKGTRIGAAVKAVQELEGHDGPIIGRILAQRVEHSPAIVPAARFAGCKVECEFAFRLTVDLPPQSGQRSRDDVAGALVFHPAIEITGSRYAPAEGRQPSTHEVIADNGNGAAFVFGPPVPDWHDMTFATLPIDARIDEVPLEVYTGVQRYDPVVAVAEIANALAADGIGLKAGDFVSTGSATVPVPIAAGLTLVATIGGLPSLRLTLA